MNANELLKESQKFHNQFLKDNKNKITELQKDAQEILEKSKDKRDKLLKEVSIRQKEI